VGGRQWNHSSPGHFRCVRFLKGRTEEELCRGAFHSRGVRLSLLGTQESKAGEGREERGSVQKKSLRVFLWERVDGGGAQKILRVLFCWFACLFFFCHRQLRGRGGGCGDWFGGSGFLLGDEGWYIFLVEMGGRGKTGDFFSRLSVAICV